MANMMKKAALVLVFGIAASMFTFAEDGWRDDNRNLRDVRNDRVEMRLDYSKGRDDWQRNNWEAECRDKAEVNHDRADLPHDNRDVRHDYRDHDGR
jgi:hypothetical protein